MNVERPPSFSNSFFSVISKQNIFKEFTIVYPTQKNVHQVTSLMNGKRENLVEIIEWSERLKGNRIRREQKRKECGESIQKRVRETMEKTYKKKKTNSWHFIYKNVRLGT